MGLLLPIYMLTIPFLESRGAQAGADIVSSFRPLPISVESFATAHARSNCMNAITAVGADLVYPFSPSAATELLPTDTLSISDGHERDTMGHMAAVVCRRGRYALPGFRGESGPSCLNQLVPASFRRPLTSRDRLATVSCWLRANSSGHTF